ncbi:uncharacterized protein BKCO1_600091 [Diplodia corticola]|uniref:Uncharacterized protein n=1 Tax=Diplodia corticola TaxID=236234 RepID=A0A1J9SB69_9PEZI|nr:uncharacterized protein BKCO1_600091 [Diplodia corticola]OJD37735.1 hypothetical protein BKCO1_600091 [Diplodia corticola]
MGSIATKSDGELNDINATEVVAASESSDDQYGAPEIDDENVDAGSSSSYDATELMAASEIPRDRYEASEIDDQEVDAESSSSYGRGRENLDGQAYQAVESRDIDSLEDDSGSAPSSAISGKELLLYRLRTREKKGKNYGQTRRRLPSSRLNRSISADDMEETSQEHDERPLTPCPEPPRPNSAPTVHQSESVFDWSDDSSQSEDEEDLSEIEQDQSEDNQQESVVPGPNPGFQARNDKHKPETGSLKFQDKEFKTIKSPKEADFYLNEERVHFRNRERYNCGHDIDHYSWEGFDKRKENVEDLEWEVSEQIYDNQMEESLDAVKRWGSYQREMLTTWWKEKMSWCITRDRWVDERTKLKDEIKLHKAKLHMAEHSNRRPETELDLTFGEAIAVSPTAQDPLETYRMDGESWWISPDSTEQVSSEESSLGGTAFNDSMIPTGLEQASDSGRPCRCCGAEYGSCKCASNYSPEEVEDLRMENQKLKWRLEQQNQMERLRKAARNQPSSRKWERIIGDVAGKIERIQVELLAKRIQLLSMDGALALEGGDVTVSLSNISTSILHKPFTRTEELGERGRVRREVVEQLSNSVGIECRDGSRGESGDRWTLYDMERTRLFYEDATEELVARVERRD